MYLFLLRLLKCPHLLTLLKWINILAINFENKINDVILIFTLISETHIRKVSIISNARCGFNGNVDFQT